MAEKVLRPLILVIDDEVNFLDIMRTELVASGCRVETAASGKEGIAKARSLHPNLILMDIQMPVMDGRQAALTLSNDPATAALPIMFLTSLDVSTSEIHDADRQFARRFGAVEYIEKLDDLSMIVKKVKDFLH